MVHCNSYMETILKQKHFGVKAQINNSALNTGDHAKFSKADF